MSQLHHLPERVLQEAEVIGTGQEVPSSSQIRSVTGGRSCVDVVKPLSSAWRRSSPEICMQEASGRDGLGILSRLDADEHVMGISPPFCNCKDFTQKSNFNGSILIFIKNLHVLVCPGLFYQISQPSSEARTLKWLFLATLIQADTLRGWCATNEENREAEPAQICTKFDGVGPSDDPLALLLFFRQCVWSRGGTDGKDEAAASPHKRHIHVSVPKHLTVKGCYRWTWTHQGYNQKRQFEHLSKGVGAWGRGTSSLINSNTRSARSFTVL